jgi:hypothetical protein
MPTTLLALRITPEPCATMVAAPPARQWNTPRRLTSITASNCSSVIFCSRASLVMPALLTSTSMLPKRSFTAATMASSASRSVTFSARPIVCAPRARTSATAASTPSGLRSQTTTAAPSSANFSAVARPMPWAAPVTMQTLCFSRIAAGTQDVGLMVVEVAQAWSLPSSSLIRAPR